MTLSEIQSSLQADASLLGDYQAMTKTELANGYCDAEEGAIEAKKEGDLETELRLEAERSAYHSALMLRYWYKIFEWQKNSYTLNLPVTDFVDWLTESLWVVFYYKTWRYEFQAVVKEGVFIEYNLDENGNKIPNPYYYKIDPNAPDKIIHRCCASMRGRVFQYHNKDKRKINTQTFSLDSMIDDGGDYAINYSGAYTEDKKIYLGGAYNLIQLLLDRGENLEALIVDSIAYYDSYKREKVVNVTKEFDEEAGEEVEYKEVSNLIKFDSRKLVKHLNNIGEDFIHSFCETYEIDTLIGNHIIDKLKSLNNIKLYKIIEKTLQEIRQTPDLLGCII